MFEGNHTISSFFSISQNGIPLLTMSPSIISLRVSVNSISVQQLHYLVNIMRHEQTQYTKLLRTRTSVQKLNNTITPNYNVLNTAKQDKGNYVTIDANN